MICNKSNILLSLLSAQNSTNVWKEKNLHWLIPTTFSFCFRFPFLWDWTHITHRLYGYFTGTKQYTRTYTYIQHTWFYASDTKIIAYKRNTTGSFHQPYRTCTEQPFRRIVPCSVCIWDRCFKYGAHQYVCVFHLPECVSPFSIRTKGSVVVCPWKARAIKDVRRMAFIYTKKNIFSLFCLLIPDNCALLLSLHLSRATWRNSIGKKCKLQSENLKRQFYRTRE